MIAPLPESRAEALPLQPHYSKAPLLEKPKQIINNNINIHAFNLPSAGFMLCNHIVIGLYTAAWLVGIMPMV